MPQRLPTGRHLYVAYVDGVEGSWRSSEPPAKAAETTEYWDGGDQTEPIVVTGRAVLGEITLTRGYDPRQDQTLKRRLRAQVGSLRTTVRIIDLLENQQPYGEPDIYTGILRSVSAPQTDAGSTDPSEWSLVFHVYRVD